MAPNDDAALLTDPVCGQPVEASTPYRGVHAGALFCFCSPRCRARFAADPSRYVVLVNATLKNSGTPSDDPDDNSPDAALPEDALGLVEPTAEIRSARPVAPGAGSGPTLQLVTIPVWPERTIGGTSESPGQVGVRLPGSRWTDVLAGLFPWHERRFARRVSRELVRLHAAIAARHPALGRRDLYRKIVASRTGGDEDSAEVLLHQAEESFASWPAARDLKFADVVHFIAVSEFLASHGNSPWIYANMGREVGESVPSNL
jgi:YHS domain-containing protein